MTDRFEFGDEMLDCCCGKKKCCPWSSSVILATRLATVVAAAVHHEQEEELKLVSVKLMFLLRVRKHLGWVC